MEKSIRQLIQISRRYGADPSQVLAGGGNSSVKTGERMWVKASGFSMKTMEVESLLQVDLERVLAIARFDGFSTDRNRREEQIVELLQAARIDPPRLESRPSVETILHALMPQRFVMHVHSSRINRLTCSRQGRAAFEKLSLPKYVRATWIDYTDPGLPLAQKVARTLRDCHTCDSSDRKCPNVIFMAKHGILYGADGAAGIDRLRVACERAVRQLAGVDIPGSAQIQRYLGRPSTAVLPDSPRNLLLRRVTPVIRSLLIKHFSTVCYINDQRVTHMISTRKGKALIQGGPLSPDHVVYCRTHPLWLSAEECLCDSELRERIDKHLRAYRLKHSDQDPRIILIPGLGGLATGPSVGEAENAAQLFSNAVEIMLGTLAFGGPAPMNHRQYTFIDNWCVESYRRKMAGSADGHSPVTNRVLLVTGAGQGVGLLMAQQFAIDGACLVLVDVDSARVSRAAAEINAMNGQSRAVAVHADVTDYAGMLGAVDTAVRCFGGLDVLISNAGILKAAKVTDFDTQAWRQIIEVNLCGAFVCAKAAAEVMTRQRSGNIIQINSKSGKKGSRYNSAYAASKFGGIGLIQSLALDLCEDGVRVNAICPGNFFDLPLWSAPGGLFDQYRIKLNNASREQVRRHYEKQIPMGRGCAPSDVVKTVYYILEQEYETGQAYNVTGGQEMR